MVCNEDAGLTAGRWHCDTPAGREELAACLVRDYRQACGDDRRTRVDMDGLIRDYLRLPLLYVRFADQEVLGFLSDGRRTLAIRQSGRIRTAVFPRCAVVISAELHAGGHAGRENFTKAHEVAHYLRIRTGAAPAAANWLRLRKGGSASEAILTREERMADHLAAALLMPRDTVEAVLQLYGGLAAVCGNPETLRQTVGRLGVSRTAVRRRLKELFLLPGGGAVIPEEKRKTGRNP